MNPLEYRFFKVTGGPIAAAYAELITMREEQLAARRAFADELGAADIYANERGIGGLGFAGDAPEGWRPMPRTPGAFVPPAGKLGKEIRKRMANLPMAGAQRFTEMLGGGIGFFGPMEENGTGFRIRYAAPEKIGDTLILLVPAGEGCLDGAEWKAPEGCEEIKPSEYLALKEALATAAV